MTTTTAPQLTVKRIFAAPRALVYRAFTEPDQFAAWWGPIGNYLPRDGMDVDVRPGGHLRWREEFPAITDTDSIEGNPAGVQIAARRDIIQATSFVPVRRTR